MLDQDVDAALHQAREIDLFHWHVADPFEQGVELELQFVHVLVELLAAQAQQGRSHRFGVLADKAYQEVGNEVHFPGTQRTHHPEIDEADYVARHDEDVARMRVGMEEAFFHDHLQQGVGTGDGNLVQVVSGGFQFLDMVRRQSVDFLHDKQPLGGVFRIDFGNIDLGIVFEHAREPAHVVRLVEVVQFVGHLFGELFDEAG